MPVNDLDEHEPDNPARLRLIRVLGAVLWPSFLTAGVATMVFFANIDPLTLRAQTAPEWEITREGGYTIGFLMFWTVCIASSALTLLLFRPPGSDGR